MRVPRYMIVVGMTARNGQRNSSQIAKEMSGTLAFVSSLRFSFVNSSKQLILKTSCFNQLVSAGTPCVVRGFLSWLYDISL